MACGSVARSAAAVFPCSSVELPRAGAPATQPNPPRSTAAGIDCSIVHPSLEAELSTQSIADAAIHVAGVDVQTACFGPEVNRATILVAGVDDDDKIARRSNELATHSIADPAIEATSLDREINRATIDAAGAGVDEKIARQSNELATQASPGPVMTLGLAVCFADAPASARPPPARGSSTLPQ